MNLFNSHKCKKDIRQDIVFNENLLLKGKIFKLFKNVSKNILINNK